MSKQYKIRWKPSDEKELARVVKNFNAKLTRLKKNPQLLETDYTRKHGISRQSMLSALPDKVSVKELKQLINSRQDLNRELNALKRFSKRGAEQIRIVPNTEYNLKITKWQNTEMNRRVGIINRRRKKRLQDLINLEMTDRGELLGYTRGDFGMGRQEELQLRPMNAFTRSMTQTGLNKKFKTIMQEIQSDYYTKEDYALRENYLKGIKENYNWEDVQDVYEHISKMDIREFIDTFNSEGGNFEIASPDGRLDIKAREYKGYETALRSTWMPNKKDK